MEQLIEKHLVAYLTNNKIVNTDQHGFLQKKPRAKCMTYGLSKTITAANTGKSVRVVYLHMTKDLIEYPILGR